MGGLTDPAFRAHTYVVIDFETLTPAGRPPEPVEVAAVALAAHDGTLTERWRFEALIRPPEEVPLTPADTAQTGITPAALRHAAPASEVLAALDAHLQAPPYRLVAHHAPHEAALLARHRRHCPQLAATQLLDTVRLARIAYPELSSHRLDTLLGYLHLPQPALRHRALPDVQATGQLFARTLTDGLTAGHWSTLQDLDGVAGRAPTPAPPPVREQGLLF